LEQLFSKAIKLRTAEDRAEYLARACADDLALRRRVEKLLRAHVTAGQFLSPDTPALSLSALPERQTSPPPVEHAGDRIGNYTLVERIGEGGCCVVYLAEQTQTIRRQVALKLIKAGMDTRQVVARFEAERQALTLMDHPAIAKVFDAGVTSQGRPYFVMELVRGLPITQYCESYKLTLHQRLELFIQVCKAVQHAHQKGIIHRDLKPSNILVTTCETNLPPSSSSTREQPAPRIIDFGIAKAMQAPLTDPAVVTWAGQFIGTPAYMSPEQAAMNSEDIDVRSDIYSLGALLYELLAGVTPLDQETLARAPFDEIRRTIQETEPLKPSARLAQRLVAAARQRAADPAAEDGGVLTRHRYAETKQGIAWVRGELDWIVMKALDKDRARRYETANDLAEDIQRFLSHEPVLAGPPSALYRARKFVRRHRVGVALAAAVALALLAGLSVALVGLRRASRAETVARQERDRAVQAEADTRRMLELFSDKLVADDEMIGLLHSAARLAREQLGPTNLAALRLLTPLAPNLGRLGAWTNALDLYLMLIETDPDNSDYWQCAHAAALAAVLPEVSPRLRQGMLERFAANQDFTDGLRLAKALLIAPDDETHLGTACALARQSVQARPQNAACQTLMGMAEYRRGNWAEALRWLQKAEHSEDSNAAPLAYCFGAMARQRLGQTSAAWEALARASRQLRVPLETGQLLAEDWHEVVFGFIARAEAERLVWGRETSPRVSSELLARARDKWKAVREYLARGEGLARQEKWSESRDAYVQALEHPSFDWSAAEEASPMRCLSLQMGIAFTGARDATNHQRLCRLLLSLNPDKPLTAKAERDATVMAERYAKTCFLQARALPPELGQRALEMARFAVANQQRRNDHHPRWTLHTGGIAEYYVGQPEVAMELLQEVETDDDPLLHGPAMAHRAMVLKKLNRPDEAARVLHDAETLLTPALQASSSLYWWALEHYKLTLDEAQRAIRGEAR
jgi:serine/threonine protein kinase